MGILRKTSITVAHSDLQGAMPPPCGTSYPPTWDVTYIARKSTSSLPDWYPTAWVRTPLQKLKFLQSDKQKADAILHATRRLSSEISQQALIRETDNVGREAKTHYIDKSGYKAFRLQAAKRTGYWEATVWPAKEDLGWPEDRVAKGHTLEGCLCELQKAIREKWKIYGKNVVQDAVDELCESFG